MLSILKSVSTFVISAAAVFLTYHVKTELGWDTPWSPHYPKEQEPGIDLNRHMNHENLTNMIFHKNTSNSSRRLLRLSLAMTRLLLKHGITLRKPVKPPTANRAMIYHGKTAAMILRDKHGEIKYCDVFRTSSISNISRYEETSFEVLLETMKQCQSVIPAKVGEIWLFWMWSIRWKLYPGTYWCGRKSWTDNWNQLGERWQEDACCRTHDFCPQIIPVGETNFNRTNNHEYTIVECRCDQELENCLTKIDSPVSRNVLYAYHNISQTNKECFNL